MKSVNQTRADTAPQLPVPKVVSQLPVNENAPTNDWDTVFAIHFNDANAAIADDWAKVSDKAKNVSQAASDSPDYNINGTLGPWQLTVGGDGKNVRMVCPFSQGTYKAGGTTYDLKDYGVVIEVGMEWVPNPDQFAFTVSGNPEVEAIAKDLGASKLDDELRSAFKKNGVTLSADTRVRVVQVGTEWLVTDGKTNFYIFFSKDKYNDEFLHVYQFQDAWKNNLQVLAGEASQENPAVVVITIENDKTTGIAAAVLPELLSEWFNANLGNFNHVFTALDLSPGLSSKDNYAWIKPTGTSYAVTDNGTMDNSVFGVLTMTQNHPAPASHQVSPNAIPTDTGANAGFLISGTAFMRNMMLAGAQSIFDGADDTDFDVTNDGLTVTNNKDLTWGRFKKDDDPTTSVSSTYMGALDQGQLPGGLVDALASAGILVQGYSAHVSAKGISWYLTSPDGDTTYLLELTADGKDIQVFNSMVFTIQEKQFKMSLDNSYLEIQFIDLKYPESWQYDVHINYTEQVALGLTSIGGKQILWFDQVTKDMTVNVTKTKEAITVEIVEDAIFAAIALVAVVAPLIDGLRAAAAVGEVTEDAGSVSIVAEGFEDASSSMSEEDQVANEANAVDNGAQQAGGRWTEFKNAFGATRWKVLGGIAAVVGAGVAVQEGIEAIMRAIAKGDWEKVPAFDEFANTAIVPYSWPGVPDFSLKSARLAASLQVGLNTETKGAP